MHWRALGTGSDDSSQDLSPCCMPGPTPSSRGSPLEPPSTVMETGDRLVHPPQGLRAQGQAVKEVEFTLRTGAYPMLPPDYKVSVF